MTPKSRQKLLLFYLIFLLVDVAVSLMAYVFEKEKIYKLILADTATICISTVDVYHFIPFIAKGN
jgi:hypothetical protein